MTAAPAIAAARGARVLHAALLLGLSAVGVIFVVLLRRMGPAFPGAPIVAYVTAGFSLVSIATSLVLFRSKIPRRPMDQAPDDYWNMTQVRGLAIVMWAMIEGASLVAWVGYFLSGAVLPAVVGAFAILILIVVRPGRLEGDASA